MRRTSFHDLAMLPGTAGPPRYIYQSKGVDPAPAVPVVREGVQVSHQVVHQAADGRFGGDVGLWVTGAVLVSMWVLHMKTQDGPPCCGHGLGSRTADLDYVCRIMVLTRYRCSDKMQCPGRTRMSIAQATNPPGRDFVNALDISPTIEKRGQG